MDHDRQGQVAHRRYRQTTHSSWVHFRWGPCIITLVGSEDSAHDFIVKFSPSVCVAVVASLTREVAVQSFAYHAHGTAAVIHGHDKTLNQQCMLAQARPSMIIILLVGRALVSQVRCPGFSSWWLVIHLSLSNFANNVFTYTYVHCTSSRSILASSDGVVSAFPSLHVPHMVSTCKSLYSLSMSTTVTEWTDRKWYVIIIPSESHQATIGCH